MGALPVINENDTVATAEIAVGDNDTLGAIVAVNVRADLLILMSDIDGLYTADPGGPSRPADPSGGAPDAGDPGPGRGRGHGAGHRRHGHQAPGRRHVHGGRLRYDHHERLPPPPTCTGRRMVRRSAPGSSEKRRLPYDHTHDILLAAREARPALQRTSTEKRTPPCWPWRTPWRRTPPPSWRPTRKIWRPPGGHISEVMLDRLALTEGRIAGMAEGVRQVAALPDPGGPGPPGGQAAQRPRHPPGGGAHGGHRHHL